MTQMSDKAAGVIAKALFQMITLQMFTYDAIVELGKEFNKPGWALRNPIYKDDMFQEFDKTLEELAELWKGPNE